MSGLEFLLRKTLSNPSEIRKTAQPTNFQDALNEFFGFCEKQLPEMLETDFIPICFDISENEEIVVLGGKNGEIGIYNLAQKKMIKDHEVVRSAINTVLLAQMDTRIIISTSNFEVIIFEYPSLKMLQRMQLLEQDISLKLGSNKSILYCSNFTEFLSVFEIGAEKGKAFLSHWKIETVDKICCIDVSDDGSLLAFGLNNGVVKLIHGESESELQSTPEYEAAPTIISFSEHRRHIGVGFKNFTLKVWNVDSNFTLKYVFTKHTGDITGLAFVKDNRYMISGSKDNTIIMWDMKVERSPYSVSLIEREVIWFKCSSDHKRLFFNQNSNCFMIWEVPQLTKNARYRKHTDKVNCVEFLYNSFELISVGDDGLAVIWDYRNDSMQEFVQLEGQLTHVIASKFGHFVLITSTKPCIYRWNLSTLNVEDYEVNSPIWCIKFSSDENMVAVGNDMNWIIIYDTEVMEKKTTIKGHVQPVSAICFIEDNNVVLSASLDRTIVKWDVTSGNKLETYYGHDDSIDSMIVTSNGWIISSSKDNCIIIWDITGIILYQLRVPEGGKTLSLFLSEDCQFLINLQQDKYYYWKMDNLTVMFQSDTQDPASWLAVSQDEKALAVAEGNTIFIEENPLRSPAIRLVGKNVGSQQTYMKFILDNIKGKGKLQIEEEHHHWVITPYLIGVAHILAYSNKIDELNNCLFSAGNRAAFFSSVNEETPLSLCVDLEYKNCIDLCLKHIKSDYFKKGNKRAYVPLGNCLTKLNTMELPEIIKIYENLFVRALDNHLPSFCFYDTNLPALYHSDMLVIYPERIISKELYSPNGRSIVFYHSLCPLYLDIGTTESIEFLESLTECSNEEIFRTSIIQVLLTNKWDRVKWAVYAQGSLYIFYMIQLSVYCILFRNETINLCMLFANNVLLFLYEVSQIITDPIDYWKDKWNILDQLRGISCTWYTIYVLQGFDDDDILLSVIIFSWIRGISYFRMFDGTRYMVRLLAEVLKDMQVFFIILCYSTLAFSFIYFLRERQLSFSQYLTVSYRLDLGDFNAEYTEIFDWIIFFIATMINPIIMLNLLISIMGDTYSKVQESNDIANFQELTEMIIEVEKLMFWKKGVNTKQFLHQVDFLTGNDEESDKIIVKIKAMKSKAHNINELLESIEERISKNNITTMENNIIDIKREQEEFGVEMMEILQKDNEILEDFLMKLEYGEDE